MFKVGELVVYRREVCKLFDIKKHYVNDNDYYVLVAVNDDTLKIEVPIDNSKLLRKLVSKEEIEDLINRVSSIKVVDGDSHLIDSKYKELMNSNSLEDLIIVIKTAYLRNKEREHNKKKISDKDYDYFVQAEKCLYQECSIVLNMSYDETKEYIIKRIGSIENE